MVGGPAPTPAAAAPALRCSPDTPMARAGRCGNASYASDTQTGSRHTGRTCSASGGVKESRNEVCLRHPMAANRSLRVSRYATIAFSPNIVKSRLAGRSRRRPPGERKKASRPRPVSRSRYPALGAGSGKSGAVTSRALYVSPDPAPSPPPQIWHANPL
jgi:hypothetical protein